MTKTLADAKLIHRGTVPRHVRRIIHDHDQCHYQREEYFTAIARNERWQALRQIPGIVKYSDTNSIGMLVYVIAWPRQSHVNYNNDDRVGTANRKATGGPPYLPLP